MGLILLAACLLSYRIIWLGYPLFPTIPGQAWQLRIDAHLKKDRDTTLTVALPSDRAGRVLIEERVTSGSLNFNILQEGANRIGAWSGPSEAQEEEIVYRAVILIQPPRSSRRDPAPPARNPLTIEKKDSTLAERLAGRWRQLAPATRVKAVMSAVEGNWGKPAPREDDVQAWRILQEKYGRIKAIIALLEASGLPARRMEGLRLVDSVSSEALTWIDIWNGKKWDSLIPATGEIEKNPASLLPLAQDGLPAASLSGGELTDIRWILKQEIVSLWRLHFERIQQSDRLLDQWSLFRLPLEYQQTFRILLLVPIGALIIGFLRNVIGFPTFGIFMPVLLALAFRSTGLIYGLGIFCGILFIGYAVRSALDRFHLLLVPRMSVMLTLVIACFTLLALVGNKIGMQRLMAVGLLPFVILTMIIERFFIMIEEAGMPEALWTVAGSAVVSIIAYGVISWEPLQLTFFTFPELLAVVAALQILLGRYTGYRVSEIFRFRSFTGSS